MLVKFEQNRMADDKKTKHNKQKTKPTKKKSSFLKPFSIKRWHYFERAFFFFNLANQMN